MVCRLIDFALVVLKLLIFKGIVKTAESCKYDIRLVSRIL